MEILILSLLIILNGFFSLSEIALVSSKKPRLEKMRQEGSKGARTVLRLLDDAENFLSAVQVGITLIGIVTGVFGGIRVAAYIMPLFMLIEPLRPFASELAMVFSVVLMTYFSIVIGELVPKTIALSNPERIAIRIAPFIHYFSRLLYPFVKLLSSSTKLVNKILGIEKNNEQMTEADLRQMIKMASFEGVIEKEQNLIHENVFYFSDKKAQHLMTHRTDVEWLDINKPREILEEEIRNIHHSKVICCNGSLDEFVGVLFQKDYFKALSSLEDFKIEDMLIEPIVIPERTDAQKVLTRLRQNESHVCFVVNEYGGFEGIITLYDIMENLVGQIPEEGESVDPDVFVRDDKSVLVSGDAPVETLADIIEDFTIDFAKIDYSTVAGFVLNQINQIPQVGDSFEYMDYIIEIMDIDGNRIDKVLIRKKE